jgi:hypothetical protein
MPGAPAAAVPGADSGAHEPGGGMLPAACARPGKCWCVTATGAGAADCMTAPAERGATPVSAPVCVTPDGGRAAAAAAAGGSCPAAASISICLASLMALALLGVGVRALAAGTGALRPADPLLPGLELYPLLLGPPPAPGCPYCAGRC